MTPQTCKQLLQRNRPASFCDDELDNALVYGYSGASTIGLEITHGFDEEGHPANPWGNLRNLT